MKKSVELFDLIGELARRRFQSAERHFAAVGLNHTEARLLTLLNKAHGLATQEELSNQLNVDRSNAGRGLKGLEQRGYVVRSENAGNKKTRLVEITDKGRNAVAEISKIRNTMADNVFGELTESEAAAAVELLQKALSKSG